jgi:hypothetical protein
MYREIEINQNSDILAITPLLPGHKISKETKVGLKRSDNLFSWVSHESSANIPTNVTAGIEEFKRRYKSPKFVIIIDRDIIPCRNMIGKMEHTLSRASDEVAYCYANFEFKGEVNARFYDLEFEPMKLLNANYISSNSLIKYDKLLEISGFITDNKYKRLLDWALWLTFLKYGYYGILCKEANFIAMSDKDSISAGTKLEYQEKYKLIKEEIIRPMVDGLII